MSTVLVAYHEVTSQGLVGHGLSRQGGFKDHQTLENALEFRRISSIADQANYGDFPADSHWRFFDWDGREIPAKTPICSIAPPRIVLACLDQAGSSDSDLEIQNFSVRNSLEQRQDIQRYMGSRESMEEARFPKSYDVFLSHSSKDKSRAMELHKSLAALNLKVFVDSEEINAGVRWEEELRTSLKSSRTGVLLLTPNSINSAWMIAEAGAMWALGMRIFPLCENVNPDGIPALIAGNQARDITAGGLLDEVCAEIQDYISTLKARSQ